MMTTKEAARKLGITEARVRALLASDGLEGEKFGRTWMVSDQSVERRVVMKPSAGRPKKEKPKKGSPSLPKETRSSSSKEAHRLYVECEQLLAGCYDSQFLEAAANDKEERFYVYVADFFLQEKQRELIKQGVF